MKRAIAVPAAFLVATVIGFLAVGFGYHLFAHIIGHVVRDEAMEMGVTFFYAPLGGIAAGIAAAFTAFRVLRPQRET